MLSLQICRNILKNYRHASFAINRMSTVAIPTTEISALPNNFRIASENWNTKTSTVGIWIDTGSRYETPKNNGAAHFLEHMAFKGTDKRTQQSLELEVENKGAHLNAYTSREMTVYYAKCLNKDIEWAVELLSDILRNSKFDKHQIERERGVILREMEEIESTYQEVVFDYLHATAFQGTSLGQTILGPEENIRSLNRDDLKSFIETHYKGPKMVLSTVGGIEHQRLVELADKYFGDLPGGLGERNIPSSRYTGSDIRDPNDKMPQAHVAIACQGPGWIHTDTLALMIASSINGAWDRNHAGMGQATSNLARSFFNTGNVHSFQNFFTCYHDMSLWGIYLTCDGNGLLHTTDTIIDEWRRICMNLTNEELDRAKNSLKTNLLLQLDGTTPVCEDIGRHMVTYGRRIPPDEMIHRIEIISADDVKKVCSKYIRNQSPSIASIGPIGGLPSYEYIKNRFYW